MSALIELKPQALWHWFAQICAIPHPSKHEQQLKEYIQRWAAKSDIPCREDSTGNLILSKPATSGMENRKATAIQAHLDMVPQKNADKAFDFTNDPIDAYIDGDWVTATDTTLGADNGIGMASALAILESTDIPHGPLEVLLTVDEEAGMTGAFGLKAGELNAEILINTDSEQEGEIYMGCAGGVDAGITLPLQRQNATIGTTYQLSVSGLKGGHSGCDIHLGRGNANKLLARFLFENAAPLQLQLCEFQGGSLRNAIPREAQVIFAIPSEQSAQLKKSVNDFITTVSGELALVEPDLKFELVAAQSALPPLIAASQNQLIALMHALPNGVERMSDTIQGVVETSLNVGVVTTTHDTLTVLNLIRSLADSCRENLANQLTAIASLAGAEIKLSGAYPGWKPDNSSPLMALVRETYEKLYNKTPEIMVIHAGLECGLFKQPYPAMDMVSIGPTIRFPHSPDEKVEIASVGLYWQLLTEILANIPEK